MVKDKVIIVTGGGSGIGLTTCHTLAENGAKVIVADLNADPAEAVAREIREKGGEADPVATAEAGWIVRPHVAGIFATDDAPYGRLPYARKIAFTADGRALYMRPDGTPKRLGDVVKNRDLAATLRALARDGAESFYTGEIARRIADDMRQNGGLNRIVVD